jgi:hypothetical protein
VKTLKTVYYTASELNVQDSAYERVMNGRYGIALVIALALTVLLLSVFIAWHVGEPHYARKGLSQWLTELDVGGCGDLEGRARAVEAIRKIGTNALPRLTAMLCVHDSIGNQWAAQLAARQSFIRLRFRSARQTQTLAVQGYQALGEIGAVNLPRLIGIMNEDGSSVEVRACVALVLGNMGRAARPAIPTLTRAAQDKDPEVRLNARLALANIQQIQDPSFLFQRFLGPSFHQTRPPPY